jgi:DNA-binding transcriptional ArsR family regulator
MLTIVSRRRTFGPVPLDPIFQALASEPRRDIVTLLSRGPVTTPVIGRQFEFSKQALSRHVGLLDAAGLIDRRRQGRVHELSLLPAPLSEAAGWLTHVRRAWEANLDRLDAVLRSTGV